LPGRTPADWLGDAAVRGVATVLVTASAAAGRKAGTFAAGVGFLVVVSP